MKFTSQTLSLLSILLFNSCVSSYYQLYKTTPSSNVNLEEKKLIFEDENVKITYSLWENKGDFGFKFENKSDENIYLKMDESFFILNGIAHNYYQNRVYSKSSNQSVGTLNQTAIRSVAFSNSKSYEVSIIEEKVICIPSKTSKIITEYSITNNYLEHCDLKKYPNSKNINSVKFKQEESPIVFSNRLTYSKGISENQVKIENSFFVSEITNYPFHKFTKTIGVEKCNTTFPVDEKIFLFESGELFYFKYN